VALRCGLHRFSNSGAYRLPPARDRGMVDVQTPLPHHLFQVAGAERIPKGLAQAQYNDLGLKMTPFEGVLVVHGCRSPCS